MAKKTSKLRAFFALPLSPSAEAELVAVSELLRNRLQSTASSSVDTRWINPANFHITVAFLGAITSADIEKLHIITAAVARRHSIDTLIVNRIAWFPNVLKPRLLVANIAMTETLKRLHADLIRQLRQAGFNAQTKTFRPHISLARTTGMDSAPNVDDIRLNVPIDSHDLILFKSEQVGGDRRYTPLVAEAMGATL